MKIHFKRWILGLGMLLMLAACYLPAEAQVVVNVGPRHHRHYHHRHRYHRHHRDHRR